MSLTHNEARQTAYRFRNISPNDRPFFSAHGGGDGNDAEACESLNKNAIHNTDSLAGRSVQHVTSVNSTLQTGF